VAYRCDSLLVVIGLLSSLLELCCTVTLSIVLVVVLLVSCTELDVPDAILILIRHVIIQ